MHNFGTCVWRTAAQSDFWYVKTRFFPILLSGSLTRCYIFRISRMVLWKQNCAWCLSIIKSIHSAKRSKNLLASLRELIHFQRTQGLAVQPIMASLEAFVWLNDSSIYSVDSQRGGLFLTPREIGVLSTSSLFLTRVGVYFYCRCLYTRTHAHTLHIWGTWMWAQGSEWDTCRARRIQMD